MSPVAGSLRIAPRAKGHWRICVRNDAEDRYPGHAFPPDFTRRCPVRINLSG